MLRLQLAHAIRVTAERRQSLPVSHAEAGQLHAGQMISSLDDNLSLPLWQKLAELKRTGGIMETRAAVANCQQALDTAVQRVESCRMQVWPCKQAWLCACKPMAHTAATQLLPIPFTR